MFLFRDPSAPKIDPDIHTWYVQQIVIDLHVDVLIQSRLFRYDISKQHRPYLRGQPLFGHADIPRMLEGGYSLAILGLHYWPWQSRRAWPEIRRQLDIMEQVCRVDPRVLLAKTASDIEQAKRCGKLALMAGIEGAHVLNGSLQPLDEAKERGCIYLTLAHFSQNSAATPGLGRKRNAHGGLTTFGHALVKRLNDLNMLVDVAHLNPACVLDACAISNHPVIASHSCAAGIYPTARALTDEGIRAIAATGGVIGIIFAPIFLRGKLRASSDAIVEHACYIADLVGPEYVALGSDFDGWIPSIPNDIRDCRDLPYLAQKLLAAGFSHPEVRSILGENFLRIIRQIT
jgi:membrane dipeptidase